MSANKKDQSKTKVPVDDDNGDSGFLSGPLDDWAGDEDLEHTKEDKVLSGLDSGLIDCDTLVESFAEVTLVDTTIPVSSHTERVPKCTVTSEERVIPAEHLDIFYSQDHEGDTQMHIASVHGCEKSVATLIKLCPNKAWLDMTNNHGHTPLHLAVMSGNAVVARMLVRAGLSVEVRDRTGETPIHKATSTGHMECLQALLAHISDQHTKRLAKALNQKNYQGQACVHIAASSGNLELLQTLVYYGADINAKENLAGWTALHIAARRGDVRLAQYLRDRCAGVQLDVLDYAGRAPRRLARHTPAARLFTEGNADDESDTDDDSYDSDSEAETLFERLSESFGGTTSINVA